MSFKRLSLIILFSLMLAIVVSVILLKLYPESNLVVARLHVKSQLSNTAFHYPQSLSTPREHELFQKSQLILLKSAFTLRSALTQRDIAQLEAVIQEEPDPIGWLQDQLQVSFPDGGENLEVRYEGTQDVEELKKIINAVIAAYNQEVVGRDIIDAEEQREKLSALQHSLESELRKKLDIYYTLSEELESQKSAEIEKSAVAAGKRLDEASAQLRELLMATDDAKEDAATKMVDSLVEALVTRPEQAKAHGIRNAELIMLKKEIEQLSELNHALAIRLRKLKIVDSLAEALVTRPEPAKAHGIRNAELTMLKKEIEQLSELNHELAIRLRKLNMEQGFSSERFRILQTATAEENIDSTRSYRIAAVGGLATFVVVGLGLLLGFARSYRIAALGGLATLVVAGLGLLSIVGFIR